MAFQVKFPFGKLVSVFVTHVEASGNFFVQINSEAGKLDALMEEIEHDVLSGRARAPNALEIMVGSIYLAQYQEDSRWYRSRVLGVNIAEQQCEVFFVDYGNTDFVPLSCIRNAEQKFCELPQQSFECELEDIDRFHSRSLEETVALLHETIADQELHCRAVQLKKNCVLVTQLFFDEKGTKSILDQMQSGGLGAEEHSLITNGESTLPHQLNRKREVKYKTMSLSPDSFHDLSVTWVEDPSHFWCQLLTNTQIIAALMENLAEVYTNLEPAALPLQSCTVGYPCCAKFYEDDAWYRGVITNVSSIATGQIEVRFVDYGNSQDTELSDVRDLKDDFLKDPCQAMYFAIAGVDPASKDGMWADEAKMLFEKLINLKHVVGLVTSVENDGRHRVKLMDTTSDLDMELNQILIAANYGVKSDDTPTATASSVTALKSAEPATKHMLQPVFAKENVQVGIEEKVLVTNIINPSKFYCQLFKNGPKLESLMQDIGHHYSKLGANEELLSSPSPGDPCCAQFSEDGCWYRAIVTNSSPKGVSIQYIDYGNSETLPVNKIKKLIPKFSDLPQQGIECTLNRIKPKFMAGEPKWKPRDTETFMVLALEKEGKLKVVTQDSSGVCRVELVVRNRREDQNVSEQLLINGNAELADGALSALENYESLKSQTYPKPDLKVGHFEDVIVSYTEHPCNFWCQLQKSATQLDVLMMEIHDLYSLEGQKSSISNPACGMQCCAQFTEDNKWYRGKITSVKRGGLVEVHFVDYGNYEILPIARVKKLQAEFLKLPPQAVKCALAKISPTNKDLLSDAVMNRFEELTLDKELVMMADKYDEVSGTFAVVLLDTTEGKNLDIASDLQTIMGPSTTREKAQIMKAQIHPDTTERVFVSSATSPAKFFCQLLKTSASLDELMNEMFEYYESLSPQQEQLSEPSLGEFCAAKFSLDDGWYRAKVLEVKHDSVSVFYIDYGNSETLSLSRLKVLNSKFQSLSSQAIECSLSGNFNIVSDDKFVDLVSEKEFTANVLKVDSGVAMVDLVSKDTNQSVCDSLNKESTPSVPCNIAQFWWKTGEAIDVFVPFAESAQKFFCQASAHSSELDDLMNRLEECYSTNTENVSTLEAGSLCVAWYDGWYRAKVEQVEGKDVTVNFIDYGDTATVALDNVRTIKPEFCLLPAQAVQCCLKGCFDRQGPENFKDLVFEQEFKANVICAKSSSVYEVDLVPGDGSASICQQLSKEVEMSPAPSLDVVSIQLKPGDKVDVFIPYVESAQKFFCQVSQNSSNLDDLMTKLEEHYSSDQEIVTSITVGTFCVARYEDGGWYRAQVTGVQGENIDVFYIDYGDAATLPLSSIRSLKNEFSSLPAQAVKCSLKGYSSNQEPENFKDCVIEQEFSAQVTCVTPNGYEVQLASKDGLTLFSRELSEEMETVAESMCCVANIQLKHGDKVDVFIPFVESAEKFFCQISQSSSDLDELMTKLEEHYSSDQEIVTSISVGTFCVARYEDGGWYRAQVTGVQGENIDVFYIDYGDAATLPLSSIRSLKNEFSSLPAQAVKCSLKGYSSNQEPENFKDGVIEQEFSAQVTCVTPNGCEVQLASKDGLTLFSSELSEEMKTVAESTCCVASIQLKPHDKIDVFIPFVESAQKFFCQISQNSSDLDELMTNLEEHYSSDQEIVTSITVGTFCVARYEDGGWYRAQVAGVEGENIDVFYIDYGDSATLPLSSIRSLKPRFSSLPAQAVKCSLKGYTSNPEPENFKDLIIEQEFEAQVTSVITGTQNTYEVELVSKDGTSSLISKTLAKDVDTTHKQVCNVPSIKLKPGDKVDVFIPFVESAQKFFCQDSQNASELDDLMNKLNEHYSSVQERLTSVSAGLFCVTQYEDGGWYRAQITQVQGESIHVFYIDYGDTATLPLSSLRSLRSDFSSLPAQAIKCHLKGCSTTDQPENFRDLVLEQEFQLQVHGSIQPGAHEVELFSKEGSKLFDETLPSEAKNNDIGINGGSFVQVCPTACISPHQFYCQVATPEHKEKLSELMDRLQEYYGAMSDQEHCMANPTVGMNCVALFADDEMWYRGRITKMVDSQLVEVYYVDFGNRERVPVSKVKTIKEEWTELPAQAIQCSLQSISPVSGSPWPDATVERFKNLTLQKKLVGKVIQKGSENSLEIELFDTTEQSVDINIGNLLVKEGLAIHGNSKSVSAVKSYAALGKAKPAENEKVHVYVSAMESPGCFFCLVSGTEEKLLALMSEISSVYDSLSKDELAVNIINVGDVCCAQFSEDNQWYRAVVEDNVNGALTVRFIDYGNTETVPISRTKILKDSFFAEPPLVVKCSLFGVEPAAGETWSDESATLFEGLTFEKELNAKFLSFTEPFEVQLNESGVDIGEELVKAKLAVSTKTEVEPIAQGKQTSGQYTNAVIECGEMYDVVMTHLSSPGKFFCQLENMKEQLDGMMTDLNDHYFELAETEGCLVSPTVGQPCVALFEEMWYRAQVLNISVNDLTVHYVDYGNEETLKPSGVKQITPSFLKTPKVAIECSLNLDRDDWPEESTGIFEELTANDEQLILKILRCQGGRYEVKVFSKDASCYSGEILSTLEGAAQEVTLKEQALQLGQTEDVYVVHTENSEDFYVQLSATYPQLEQMMADIAEVYSGLSDDVAHEDVVVGTPVCAQFPEDNSWYRALIKRVHSDFEVEVHYVDYGNSEVLLLSDVRQLSRKFFNLPVQAVRCSLDSPLVESFGQRVADKELRATFLSLEKGKWKVSLFDGDGKIGLIDVPHDSDDTILVGEFIMPSISPEMKERVYVSHVVSPDEFYVQFESALDDLSALSGELSQFYFSLGPSTNALQSPSPGMSCCARFSQDGDWYRGRVKRVTSSGAEVEFVDYGNGEVVPFNRVKDPKKDFMQLPRQAILCGLDATKDYWSAEEVNIFKSVALDKSFDAKFIIRDGQKWRVSLDSGGVSIVDMFITKDAADLQQEGREISSVQVGRYAFPPVTSGQIEEVFVSHVTESGDFYIQLSKSSADLDIIENLVSEIYDQPGATAEAMEMCFVDSLCCARFREDLKWYRALVTKVFSDTEVEVLFVDYGNTDSLHVASLKQLRPELLKFPVQAVKCRLEGSKDIWTESDVQQFESKVLEKPLHVTFVRQEGTTWFVTVQELDMFSSNAKLTAKERSFSTETLDLNKREEAYFLFANSPDCFWLNLVRTGDALVRLMDQIANEVTDQPLEKSHVKAGLACLGMYTENDMWYRAQIVDVQGDANAVVSYIDYGNSETLPHERLHAISESQMKLPAQGICCRLAGVQGVDPDKITNYLNEMLVEKVVEFEVQNQHADGSYTVKLFHPGASQSVNDQVVGECLGDTSLVEETRLEQASPPRLPVTHEGKTFKLPELQSGSKVPVSFVSAFLPAEMQLLLTERIGEKEQLTESITSMYNNLSENELKLDNPSVGMLCCVHFSEKWFRGEIISISADGTATVKLVDCGTHEKIPISELKSLKDELLQTPVFVLESTLANIHPSSEDGQWSPECSSVLESLCRSKALIAEITHVFGDMVELILNDESGKQINQSLVELGYARAFDMQGEYLREQPSLKWPELQIGQSLDAYLMAAKDLESIQLQLDDPDAGLSRMMKQISVLYSNLGETEEVIGNPRVGQVCCAQFSENHDWYRAVVTSVLEAGVEVKFVDYGNIDVALMVKQLREEFYSLPVQCVDCSLHGVVSMSEKNEEIAAKLAELCESKKLKAEIINVSGDSVVVNLFLESGETLESVADVLVKLGLAHPQPTVQEERRISISEEGKMVYNYPESGNDFVHNISLISTRSPSEFWCQLVDSVSELKTLSDKIEHFYQSLGENDLRFLCLQVGDTCCAQFTDDNKWHRSQVNKVCSDGQVCVRAVDYVKQETLSLDRIKKLDPGFAVLPVQALCCSLAGIEPPHKYYEEDWSSDAVRRFQELCQGKDVRIKIKETVGHVVLVDLVDSTGLSIANQLLLEGLAVKIKSPMTESPVKDVLQKQEFSSNELEVEIDKDSSEENGFEEALSGVEGVDALTLVEMKTEIEDAKSEEDEDDDDEEFLDSNDQVIEDVTEVSAGHECDKGVSHETEEDEQAVKNEEKQQDHEHRLQATEEQEEVTMSDKGNNEEDENRLQVTDAEEMYNVESDEKKEEEREDKQQMINKEEEKAVKCDEEKQEEEQSGLEANVEPEEQAVEDVDNKEGGSGPQTAEDQEVQTLESNEKEQGANGLQTPEEQGELVVKEDEAEQEGQSGFVQTTGEVQVEEMAEEISSPVSKSELEEVDKENSKVVTKEVEDCESKEQVIHRAVEQEQTETEASKSSDLSEEVECQAKEEVNNAETSEAVEDAEKSGREEHGGLKLEEMSKDELEKGFVEPEDVVTEAFSEEDLSAITGSAGETVETTFDDEKSEIERLKESNIEEVVKQTSEAEASAKVFLEELLSDVCRSIDKQMSEDMQSAKESNVEDTSKSPIAAEQQEEIVNSDTACCNDVGNKVLCDEALDKLDKELGGESYDENEPGVNRTGAVLNGTGEEEIHGVLLENGQDSEDQ